MYAPYKRPEASRGPDDLRGGVTLLLAVGAVFFLLGAGGYVGALELWRLATRLAGHA